MEPSPSSPTVVSCNPDMGTDRCTCVVIFVTALHVVSSLDNLESLPQLGVDSEQASKTSGIIESLKSPVNPKFINDPKNVEKMLVSSFSYFCKGILSSNCDYLISMVRSLTYLS